MDTSEESSMNARVEAAAPAPATPGVVRDLLVLALKMSVAQVAPLSAAIYLATCMGRLGATQLSAYSLVSSTNLMVFLSVMNALQALYYVGGKAMAEGQRGEYEHAISAGLTLALRLAVFACAVSAGVGAALYFLGFDANVVKFATGIGLVSSAGIPAALVLVVYRVHAALNGRAGFITLVTTAGALVVCLLATLILWFAKGQRQLSVLLAVVGVDVSTTWLMLAVAAVSVRRFPELGFTRSLRSLLKLVHRPTLRLVVAMGWPVGAVVLLDSLASVVGQYLVGRFWLEALPVHAVVVLCTSIGIVIPVGISLAALQHVAMFDAKRDWASRNRAALASIGVSILYGSLVMAIFCVMPKSVGAAVLGPAFDAARQALYGQLMLPGGIVLAFQSEIIVVAAVYRGVGDTRTPLLVALVGYVVVAGAAQILLAFAAGYGARGIWWGLAIGFGAIACVATLGIYRRLRVETARSHRELATRHAGESPNTAVLRPAQRAVTESVLR
jgi:MATE family multidrug resistance protein